MTSAVCLALGRVDVTIFLIIGAIGNFDRAVATSLACIKPS